MDLTERFKITNPDLALAHCLAALDEGKEPPRERLIFPAGEFQTTKGNFLFDGEAAKLVMDDWAEWTGGLPQKGSSDYEHDQAKDNIPGHEKIDSSSYDLDLHRGALWAVNINWTDRAASMIKQREKRYTSPWWLFEKGSKRIVRYINFGLVSLPATIAQPELMPAAASASVSVQVPQSFAGFLEIGAAFASRAAATAAATAKDEGAVVGGAVEHEKYPLDKSATWDGDAVRKRAREFSSSDGSGKWETVDKKKYRLFFAYVKGDGSSESDYLLPHHDVKAGKMVTVWGGVRAAGGAVQGARTKADIREKDLPAVKAHLVSHYHEFGKTAPWEKKPAAQRKASALPEDLREAFIAILEDEGAQDTADRLRAVVFGAVLDDEDTNTAEGETPAQATASSETAKMADNEKYKDPNFVPTRHAYALRYMASSAMENMMTAIHLHNEVPMMAAAMNLPSHCASMADHVMHCAAAMQHHMHADETMDDGEPDGDEASKAAMKLPAELKAKVDEAIAACKAAKAGGLLQRAHKAALASVGATRFDKAALAALGGTQTLVASVLDLTSTKSLAAAAGAVAALKRDTATAQELAAKAQKEAEDAKASADQVKYDDALASALKDGRVLKGDDEAWVRANIKGTEALAGYLATKKRPAIATNHEQGTPGQSTTLAALASQTTEQRRQVVESVELSAEEYAGWVQTGGGEDRLIVRKEAKAKELGLIL